MPILSDRFFQNIFYRLDLSFESLETSFPRISDFLQSVHIIIGVMHQKSFESEKVDQVNFLQGIMGFHQ